MSTTAPRRTESATARRVGYALAVLINGLLLSGVNVWPGWRVLPFLTEDTRQVLGLVNLSLIAGMIANAVYVITDRTWLKALGDLVTLGIGMAVLVGFWEVFPFDFTGSSLGWATVARVDIKHEHARRHTAPDVAEWRSAPPRSDRRDNRVAAGNHNRCRRGN